MITKRKKYVKPMIGIIVSKRRMRLLTVSGEGKREKYVNEKTETWGDES